MAKKTPEATTTEPKKATCPITREQFTKAAPILIEINGEKKVASPKEFSTGSFGFFFNEKSIVMIDGVPTKVQWNCLGTVVGSKDTAK